MKKTEKGKVFFLRRFTVFTAVLVVAFSLFFSGAVVAQGLEDYEYEPGEGLHEEEWYDPSDWFDVSDQVSFEYDDWWDFGYGYDEGIYDNYDSEYGYGNDEYYGVSPAYDDEGIMTDDLYTEEWYEDEGVFDGWFE